MQMIEWLLEIDVNNAEDKVVTEETSHSMEIVMRMSGLDEMALLDAELIAAAQVLM